MGLLSKSSIVAKKIRQRSAAAAIGLLLLGVVLALSACSGQSAAKPVKATWVKAQVAGDSVSISASEVASDKIVHFNVPVAMGNQMAFMAYELDGKINVRANVCPPCRSVGFSLSKDTLVCDTCRTTFKAATGEGISGACVAYPKASVQYETGDGKLVMQGSDLLAAYWNTTQAGLP